MRFILPVLLLAAPVAAQTPTPQRLELLTAVCHHGASCGCPEENCVANLAKATHVADEAMRCVAEMACADLCAQPAAGTRPKTVTQCFDPARWPELRRRYAAPPALSAERHAAVQAACVHIAGCGCAEEDCMPNFSKASGLPLAGLTCVTGVACADLCTPGSGTPGSVVYDRCFAPEDAKALHTTEKARAIASYCQKLDGCGCPEAECAATFTKNTSNFGLDLFVCFNGMECSAACEPNALQTGSQGFTRCIAPALSRAKAGQALEAARLRSQHRVNMGIIRAIGGSGQRVKIYDRNGSYLRTESR